MKKKKCKTHNCQNIIEYVSKNKLFCFDCQERKKQKYSKKNWKNYFLTGSYNPKLYTDESKAF